MDPDQTRLGPNECLQRSMRHWRANHVNIKYDPFASITSRRHHTRGGPNFDNVFFFFFFFSFCFVFLVDEFREDPKYHYKRANISPPAKRHLNGVSLVCR